MVRGLRRRVVITGYGKHLVVQIFLALDPKISYQIGHEEL
jgi:hypothetical protein